ncbi:MAG: MerR family transcriptional regulator [Actinomycetota bacterium]
MADQMTERPYLSIGEVLALLLEEFPDVTISKIRFLESQGLIDPERTPSGYRKFYEPDVERLRVILREQRENFLPLRVIRDRLENGQIDDSGALTPPRGIRNVVPIDPDATGEQTLPPEVEVPTSHHPAAQLRAVPQSVSPVAQFFAPSPGAPPIDEVPDTFVAADLCSIAGITSKQLAELESYGLVSGKGSGSTALYSAGDLAVVKASAGFLLRGVEARHLRAWKQSAEREAALFEQLVLPMLRQRNPQSRQQASTTLVELAEFGAQLRSALLGAALRQHLEG